MYMIPCMSQPRHIMSLEREITSSSLESRDVMLWERENEVVDTRYVTVAWCYSRHGHDILYHVNELLRCGDKIIMS